MFPSLKRRHFLSGTLAGLIPVGLGCTESGPRELWASAQGSEISSFSMAWAEFGSAADQAQSAHHQISSGFRGHDVIAHPARPGRIVFVARHPGIELVEIDVATRTVTRRVASDDGFVLCGHACFSSDGSVVFVVESDAQSAEGRIVVRDAFDYRPIEVFSSYGIGPHEMVLMPDGRTLAIANGGLLTKKGSGDSVLNLDTMKSELCFVDAHSGKRLQTVAVDEPKASIRHLDVTERGELSIALQMQREGSTSDELAPLAALYDVDHGLRVLQAPDNLLLQCQDYMGSTRINKTTRVAGFTSPRGDMALFWDIDTQELRGYHRLHDVCGLTVSLDESVFVLSNSTGTMRCLDARTLQEVPERSIELPDYKWDNHLRTIDLS